MIRIGIVGAENSHTAAIAKLINVEKKVKGAKVVMLWGETDEFARKAADAGQIPTIVKDPAEMVGQVDAVVIDHRHPKFHLEAAEPFLKAKIPMFIDKPFCYRAKDGRAFLKRAKKAGVPVTSYSVLPEQKSYAKLRKAVDKAGAVKAMVTIGPCDIDSPYGGVFFYGIHQVDAVLKLIGYDVKTAQVTLFKGGDSHTATLGYADGKVVTLNLVKSYKAGFHFTVYCEGGVVCHKQESDDNPYLAGTKKFVQMFKTGQEPEDHEHILMPVRVLEAMEKSIKSGKREKV